MIFVYRLNTDLISHRLTKEELETLVITEKSKTPSAQNGLKNPIQLFNKNCGDDSPKIDKTLIFGSLKIM